VIVGSALCQGPEASIELARDAVLEAMEGARCEIATEVLLFLTHEFARDPQPAILAAARASRCTRIGGCSAIGVLNERTWVLDAPAAAVLVFAQTSSGASTTDAWRLALFTPQSLDFASLRAPGRRFGAVTSAASGRGAHAVWQGGRVSGAGCGELVVPGGSTSVHVVPGIRPLSALLQVTAVDGLDLLACDHAPAWSSLLRLLPPGQLQRDEPPWAGVVACIANDDPHAALADGRYEIVPLLACDPVDNAVSLARPLAPGVQFFWGLRDPEAAVAQWHALFALSPAVAPAYGLFFSCIGRGAGFYGGRDRDWQAVRDRFPGMPFAGFYGNGAIAWCAGANRLLQYASVLALFADAAS